MQRIERLVDTLQTVPGLHDVTLRSSPVNADSGSTLSGKTYGADSTKAPSAQFSISLTYREASR
jgi:hypothetical protein